MGTTITTLYRAEVQVPSDVFEAFGRTREYELRSAQIYRESHVGSAGQDAYAEVYEWAEDSSRACVENWAAAWELYINELQRKMKEV